VAANLPYVAHDEWSGLLPEIREHEPGQALDGGADGLQAIRRLLETATEYLRPQAMLGIEIGARQGTQALQAARLDFPAADIEVRQDYADLDRLLVVRLEHT
jgi:release factor glutamine methyltransferase